MIGIGKRQLLEDYYPDEIAEIIRAYSEIKSGGKSQGEGAVEEVDAATFFGI